MSSSSSSSKLQQNIVSLPSPPLSPLNNIPFSSSSPCRCKYESECKHNTSTTSPSSPPLSPSILPTPTKSKKFNLVEYACLVPFAEVVKAQRDAKHVEEQEKFAKELLHIFEREIANDKPFFTICDRVEYYWQYDIIKSLFELKNYDLHVYTYTDNNQKTYYRVDLSIPKTHPYKKLGYLYL